MGDFWHLAGWALIWVGLGFMFHGPTFIVIHKHYNEKDDEE